MGATRATEQLVGDSCTKHGPNEDEASKAHDCCIGQAVFARILCLPEGLPSTASWIKCFLCERDDYARHPDRDRDRDSIQKGRSPSSLVFKSVYLQN